MKNKYDVGDYVFIDKRFDNSTHGEWVSTKKIKVLVEKIQKTPTFGWGYLLSYNGDILPVYYWESDILGIDNISNEEKYWKIWGDI